MHIQGNVMEQKNIFKQLLLIFFLTTFNTFMANNITITLRDTEQHSHILTHFTELETERLIIRKMNIADSEDIFSFTSDPEIIRLTPIFELTKTKYEAINYIEKCMGNYAKGNSEFWAIVYKKNNKVIGIVCIDILSRYKGDIGYAITREYWGNGIATEAAKAVINFGFNVLGLKRIEGTCDPRNKASARVLEKCGMSYEGLLKSYYYHQDEFCDRKLYAIVNI
jgi:[ribosomal protein S5]-alanine N-acetyltransferase